MILLLAGGGLLAFLLGFLFALEVGTADRNEAFDIGVNGAIRQLGGRSFCKHYGGDGNRSGDQELPMVRTKCHKCTSDAGCPVVFDESACVNK